MMGSNKGKGRQAGGFGSKAMRAQFRSEWQGRFHEERQATVHRRNIRQRQGSLSSSSSSLYHTTSRPKIRLNSLRHMIQERSFEDRIEHRAARQRRMTGNATTTRQGSRIVSRPREAAGWILSYPSTQYERQRRQGCVPCSLQNLCLQQLALHLNDYLIGMGNDALHQCLSLLPGPTLTELSLLVSQTLGMTDSLVRLFCLPTEQLCLVAPSLEEDSSWNALTDDGLLSLIPKATDTANNYWVVHDDVPDSWEDAVQEDDADEDESNPTPLRYSAIRWTRLELGNLPRLSADTLQQLLQKCASTLTHLGLVACLDSESGPEVLWNLSNWAPHLQVLDVSHSTWVTEGLLRELYRSYSQAAATNTNGIRRQSSSSLLVKAVGCLPATSEIAMELEFGHERFWPYTYNSHERVSSQLESGLAGPLVQKSIIL